MRRAPSLEAIVRDPVGRFFDAGSTREACARFAGRALSSPARSRRSRRRATRRGAARVDVEPEPAASDGSDMYAGEPVAPLGLVSKWPVIMMTSEHGRQLGLSER